MSWSPFSVLKFKRVHHDYISISSAKVYFQGVFLSNTQKVILIYYWSTVAALGFSSGRASCILMRFPIKLFSYCAYQTIMTICAKCNVIGTQFVHNILTLAISGGPVRKPRDATSHESFMNHIEFYVWNEVGGVFSVGLVSGLCQNASNEEWTFQVSGGEKMS